MNNKFQINWDKNQLAKALCITPVDVNECFTDGRCVSFIIEWRLVRDHPDWNLIKSEASGYELFDPNERKWKVKTLTKQGINFSPSYQVGSKREFNEKGFQKKLSQLKGFIIADIEGFPAMDVYVVPVGNVKRWHSNNILGKNAAIGRKKFLNELVPDIEYDQTFV